MTLAKSRLGGGDVDMCLETSLARECGDESYGVNWLFGQVCIDVLIEAFGSQNRLCPHDLGQHGLYLE